MNGRIKTVPKFLPLLNITLKYWQLRLTLKTPIPLEPKLAGSVLYPPEGRFPLVLTIAPTSLVVVKVLIYILALVISFNWLCKRATISFVSINISI